MAAGSAFSVTSIRIMSLERSNSTVGQADDMLWPPTSGLASLLLQKSSYGSSKKAQIARQSGPFRASSACKLAALQARFIFERQLDSY
jgi:hypothetical protein